VGHSCLGRPGIYPRPSSFYIFRTTFAAGYSGICASPGLLVRGAGFQTRENALSCNDRALALVRVPQAAQSTRTFFVTSTTAGRRALLQSDRMAQLLVDVLAENRRKGRFLLHEFVIMPNHFHLLLTPAAEIPLEKALQFIKGGFSYRAKREIVVIGRPGINPRPTKKPSFSHSAAQHRWSPKHTPPRVVPAPAPGTLIPWQCCAT
jgi:REP element-mobilizing transposase RayT